MKEEMSLIGQEAVSAKNVNSRAIGDVIAMQLASITYCSLNGEGAVENSLKRYLPDCELVWKPERIIEGNYAIIVKRGAQYIVAIRGSILQLSWASYDNWLHEDFNVFEQVPWTFTNDTTGNPMISKGSKIGLDSLIALTDANGFTIFDFLKLHAFPSNKFLAVTGHSLGANLATVFAPWLRYQMLEEGFSMPGIFSVLTFAAPTSWNKAFADQFDQNFTNSWRYFNVIDVVPYSATNIAGLAKLFPGKGMPAEKVEVIDVLGYKVTLAQAFEDIAKKLKEKENSYNSYYTLVNQGRGSVPLNMKEHIFPVSSTDPEHMWFDQIGEQHAHNHYLSWLGAPPITCLIPSTEKFDLTLDTLIKGSERAIWPAICNFSYNWDFERGTGLASLDFLNDTAIGISLHPLGIEGYLDFMSDLEEPVKITIDDLITVTIKEIGLSIELGTNKRSAFIVFNVNADVIQGTSNILPTTMTRFL